MQDKFKDLLAFIEEMEISEEQKEHLLSMNKHVEKEYFRLDFLYKRGMKDKSITINLLHRTVEQLQQQNEYIAETNQQLSHQTQLLEEQSQKLSKNLQALQMSYAELEQFAYIASHDLKSPLRNIGSYAQLLKRRYYDKFDANANEFIDFIVNNATQMNMIISDLLEYSRADSQKELVKVDFNKMIEIVKINLREAILSNKAVIEIEHLPTIFGVRSAIIQLLQNLVENAIKYQSNQKPHIIIKAQKEGEEYWRFSLSDNGVGLNEAYQDKAFQPFQRLGSRDRPGSGMGLAICRKVVKLHGGNIWYNSANDNTGTTFHFTIPINSEE